MTTVAETTTAEPTAIPFEIERKYLVHVRPELSHPILAAAKVLEIEQTYLTQRDPEWKERVRLTRSLDGVSYFHTRKQRLQGIVKLEDEQQISEQAFSALLARRDPERQTIRKTRLVFPFDGRAWELDLFHVPAGLCLLEVELEHEDALAPPPAWLGELEDVSTDKRYSNRTLAKLEDGSLLRRLGKLASY